MGKSDSGGLADLGAVAPEAIQKLIDEMVKPRPDDQRVRTMMQEMGLPFHEDPIDQMNMLLRALHGVPTDKISM